ncbi:hypothetical protein CR513_15461, partial [Mucuna pruriens]
MKGQRSESFLKGIGAEPLEETGIMSIIDPKLLLGNIIVEYIKKIVLKAKFETYKRQPMPRENLRPIRGTYLLGATTCQPPESPFVVSAIEVRRSGSREHALSPTKPTKDL